MPKLFLAELQQKVQEFTACETMADLEKLDFAINRIKLLSLSPPYYHFKMRKSSGGFREIEAPELELKELQRQFNTWLQCVYYTLQSPAAYGYIIRVRDVLHTKNILENAKLHHGAKYMLNVDFEDFFHQVSRKQVFQILKKTPFQFGKKAAGVLANLFCRNGRLPMGAPTSPVLSNLATLELDAALLDWADGRQITYSRFVDDLTFSSKKNRFDSIHLQAIKTVCREHGMKINPFKTKFYGAEDTKKVTGLVLNETVDIDPGFYGELNKNLKRLRHLTEVNLLVNQHKQDEVFRKFKQEVEGQINFIGMIEGYGSRLFYSYRQKMKAALNPDEEEVFSAKWTNSNYF